MSVRKRKWTTNKGEEREVWIVDYKDQRGERHIETFDKKGDAVTRHAEVRINVKKGIHVAASKSITVAEAGKRWADEAEAGGLERATVRTYRQHVDLHIVPFLGRLKLSEISVPVVTQFKKDLRAQGRSPALVRKVLVSLGSLIADAQESGLAAHNAVRELRRNKRRGERHARSEKRKLQVGVDIPEPVEVSAILAHGPTRWRPLLVIAAFTGLRASELRGLRWQDVDLDAGELHVRQRADRFNEIGAPKSEAGERTVPFGKIVANTLREWKLRCPKGDADLVFPTASGQPVEHSNLVRASIIPACKVAGLVNEAGEAKYTGLHSLRHFYASWLINRPQDGGLGLPPKTVQERMGHSSITITLDTYSHLFKGADDAEEIGKAEEALLHATQTRHAG